MQVLLRRAACIMLVWECCAVQPWDLFIIETGVATLSLGLYRAYTGESGSLTMGAGTPTMHTVCSLIA